MLLSNVNSGPLVRIRFGLAEDLAADWSSVAFAEGEELEEIRDRVAFRPAEVGVRNRAGAIAEIQQQPGDGVGDRRTRASQHAVAADVDARHLEDIGKLR